MCECIRQYGKKYHSEDCPERYPNPPHIHAETIKAWANGAVIETRTIFEGVKTNWKVVNDPRWNPSCEYRVKVEPPPDVVRYARASFSEYDIKYPADTSRNQQLTCTYWSKIKSGSDNIRATFDGETGNLKRIDIM